VLTCSRTDFTILTAGELTGGFMRFSTVELLGRGGAGSLAIRIAANSAAPQGERAGVIAGLAGEIRMRYGRQAR
jgi:hypothetical protein